ncbi:MAG TPA: hypothetical protein VHC98_03890, partial [Candidatus Saccharimonadales bacterium]|nr:hypothetical protein [Candidatus Saccharimonadales bacterium]
MIRALMSNAAKRSKYLIASAVLAASSLVIAGVSIVAQPQFAQAATNCPYDPSFPETNVAFCGVWQQNGANATLAQDISSLQKIYADSKDSCTGAGVGKDGAKCTVHTDLRAVITAFYGNAGSIIPSMNATDGNTLLAVSCKDGTVRSGDCNGTVLGTGMRIAARWHESGSDFQHIINDVYTHSPSTFFNDDFSAVPTLVHKSATT